MASIHTSRAIDKARDRGAFAGSHHATGLWELSKREILEVALRLAAMNEGACDSARAGVVGFNKEYDALRRNKII